MSASATIYDTAEIAPRKRFAYWSDVICDAYLPITCATPDPSRFQGKIQLNRFSRLAISHVTGSPQNIQRGRGEIGRNTQAYFMVSLQLSGRGEIQQDGRQAILNPGDFAIYSTGDPYHIRCREDVNQLVLQLPSDALLERVPHAEALTAHAVSAEGGLGAMLSGQIRQCAGTIAEQATAVQGHMQDMLLDAVATGLSSVRPTKLELSRPNRLLMSRAKSFIHSNLKDERLDRDALASAMGMSKRQLGRVFEREGHSIATFIRQARLDAVARDLADPQMANSSITELGCKWGLSNAQHLSKLFKDAFGQSPRSYRREKLSPNP